MQAPVIIKQLTTQGVNERAAYGPVDMNEFIKSPDGSTLRFQAEIANGASLPKGLICTSDGIFTGIPAKNTQGVYDVRVHAVNEAGSVELKFILNIQPNLAEDSSQSYIDELKQQIWLALEQNMPSPDIADLLARAVTPSDVYYLLERWATLTIYDAFNLDAPGEKKLMVLEGASEHFLTYDRGSCLVACPKDLFSCERTLADGIHTAEALAREAYKRNWTVELIGFEKLTRAAWVEIQYLSDVNNRKMEILNYEPSDHDMKLHQHAVERAAARKGLA